MGIQFQDGDTIPEWGYNSRMGKRTDFEKHGRDYYFTPLDPIKALVPYLLGQTYAEPCVGGGDLVYGINYFTFRLTNKPRCLFASDLEPDFEKLLIKAPYLQVYQLEAAALLPAHLVGIDLIVTNPPFSWSVLSGLLPIWINIKPTWLLLPSDMANNVRFSQFMSYCSDIIPVGRVSWMENGQSGMENYSWYMFDAAWDKDYARQHPR